MTGALNSPDTYSRFIHHLPERYSSIRHSTLRYRLSENYFGKAAGKR